MNDKYKIVDVELWCADQVGEFQLAPCDIEGCITANVFCENEKLMLSFNYYDHIELGHHEQIDAIRSSIHNVVVRDAKNEKIDVLSSDLQWVMNVVERLYLQRYIC